MFIEKSRKEQEKAQCKIMSNMPFVDMFVKTKTSLHVKEDGTIKKKDNNYRYSDIWNYTFYTKGIDQIGKINIAGIIKDVYGFYKFTFGKGGAQDNQVKDIMQQVALRSNLQIDDNALAIVLIDNDSNHYDVDKELAIKTAKNLIIPFSMIVSDSKNIHKDFLEYINYILKSNGKSILNLSNEEIIEYNNLLELAA